MLRACALCNFLCLKSMTFRDEDDLIQVYTTKCDPPLVLLSRVADADILFLWFVLENFGHEEVPDNFKTFSFVATCVSSMTYVNLLLGNFLITRLRICVRQHWCDMNVNQARNAKCVPWVGLLLEILLQDLPVLVLTVLLGSAKDGAFSCRGEGIIAAGLLVTSVFEILGSPYEFHSWRQDRENALGKIMWRDVTIIGMRI
mmetsp:Transcript_95361/g.246957  ORF Transcript_95361/g.246957 Transcript_95361/m.246957 type:complete len:201 (+) Transcript_95361:125-727(+)